MRPPLAGPDLDDPRRQALPGHNARNNTVECRLPKNAIASTPASQNERPWLTGTAFKYRVPGRCVILFGVTGGHECMDSPSGLVAYTECSRLGNNVWGCPLRASAEDTCRVGHTTISREDASLVVTFEGS